MALAPGKNGSAFKVKSSKFGVKRFKIPDSKFKIVGAGPRACPGFGVWILTSEDPAPNTELMTPNFPTGFCRLNPGWLFNTLTVLWFSQDR